MTQMTAECTAAPTATASGEAGYDKKRFEEFRARLLPQLIRWGAGDEAEDLAHDALIVLFLRMKQDSLAEPEQAYGYLRGTAKRLLMASRRKRLRRKTDADSTLVEGTATQTEPPDQQIAMQELTERTRGLVEQLKQSRDRLLVQKHYLCDQDKVTVEKDMRLSADQFHRVLYRCRQRLRVIAAPQARDLQGLMS